MIHTAPRDAAGANGGDREGARPRFLTSKRRRNPFLLSVTRYYSQRVLLSRRAQGRPARITHTLYNKRIIPFPTTTTRHVDLGVPIPLSRGTADCCCCTIFIIIIVHTKVVKLSYGRRSVCIIHAYVLLISVICTLLNNVYYNILLHASYCTTGDRRSFLVMTSDLRVYSWQRTTRKCDYSLHIISYFVNCPTSPGKKLNKRQIRRSLYRHKYLGFCV